MSKEFMSIKEIMDVQSEYALKACEEAGKNKETNLILWYASRLIRVYERFGNSTKIEKDIEDFRRGNWELCKIIERREAK